MFSFIYTGHNLKCPAGTVKFFTVLGRAPNGPARVHQNGPNETVRLSPSALVKSRLGTVDQRVLVPSLERT